MELLFSEQLKRKRRIERTIETILALQLNERQCNKWQLTDQMAHTGWGLEIHRKTAPLSALNSDKNKKPLYTLHQGNI